jgi:MFS family permease
VNLRAARTATAVTFASNGFLFAAWIPHIPEVKNDLHLSDASLGLALLGPAFGSLFAMALIGRITTRFGSAPVTVVAALATYVAAPGPGIAFNLPTLFLSLMIWGFTAGGLDVAMNAQAVQVETRYERPIMSSFHAFWSVGTVAGTVAGGIGAGAGISLATQQAGLALVCAAATLVLRTRFVPDAPHEPPAAGARSIDRRLVLLGIAALFALVAEGSSADWSPVYLRDDLHVSPGHAGVAFTAFTIMMTTGRMVGDRVVLALGRARAISVLAAIGSVGFSIGLAIDTVASAAVGFACLGLGLSVMVPVLFSTTADGPGAPGSKLAFVSSVGYIGFLVGPSTLGPIANATNVHTALWTLPLFAALAGVLGVAAVRMTERLATVTRS